MIWTILSILVVLFMCVYYLISKYVWKNEEDSYL